MFYLLDLMREMAELREERKRLNAMLHIIETEYDDCLAQCEYIEMFAGSGCSECVNSGSTDYGYDTQNRDWNQRWDDFKHRLDVFVGYSRNRDQEAIRTPNEEILPF